jgi:AAA family ATP:ADP antiporter
VLNRLQRLIQIQPTELVAVGWSWLFFFSVLTAYYVIRPIRDDMGVAGGVENLPWLFTGTLVGMAIANPAFGFLATRLPRERLVSAGYRFFAINLVLFFAALHLTSQADIVWAGRIFFVWTAVFNMFAVSIFWSVMTDAFSTGQGKRLFGFIGAGGTIGGIAGAALTSSLVGLIGAANLLLVSAALLEVAGFAARRVFRESVRSRRDDPLDRSIGDALGGKAWDGFSRTFRDSYLSGIALHVILFTVLTTFLYFQQATIVDAAIADRLERTRFFAKTDLMVNLITLATQSFATGHLVRVFGLTTALAVLPALSLIGFLVLGATPTVMVLMIFQVLRRSSEFAIARPSREVLFTSAARQDRYKAKNFIDTFVYRTGDQVGAWWYAGLAAIGLGVSGTSVVGAVVSGTAIAVAIWLGRRHRADTERVRQAA